MEVGGGGRGGGWGVECCFCGDYLDVLRYEAIARPRKERKKEKDLKELESSLNMFCLRSKGVKEFKIIYLYIVRDFPLKCTVWFYIDSFLAQLTNEK